MDLSALIAIHERSIRIERGILRSSYRRPNDNVILG